MTDLGEQPSQRQRLLHHLWRGEPAGGSLQHTLKLWRDSDTVGQDRLSGLHQEDRAAGRYWRSDSDSERKPPLLHTVTLEQTPHDCFFKIKFRVAIYCTHYTTFESESVVSLMWLWESVYCTSVNEYFKTLSYSLDRHDALFVVGSLDETLELRGLRYHPIDIETSISRAHRSIAER